MKYYEFWNDGKSAWLQHYDEDPCNYGMLTWNQGVEAVVNFYNCQIETVWKDITEENYTEYLKQEVCV